ncbi:MAG: agmatine deiminase family protein [Undibacterium curvum]|uniref:agmatine deiminase family protein n=1 Tax=Undibacterium curvum TaxID=2762294 RepID=UPI003BE97BF7
MPTIYHPPTRRQFMRFISMLASSAIAPAALSACGGGSDAAAATPDPQQPVSTQPDWLLPDEGDRHLCSWMSFNVSADIWGKRMLTPVQDALARIANTIIQFEALKVIVSPANLAVAKAKLDPRIQLVIAASDDLWIRDTGCLTVRNRKGQRRAISFNFNGWGNKQRHEQDATVAATMSSNSQLAMLRSRLVLEGGGIEVDGQGTAIITESCVLNSNRNPGWSKAEAEAELLTTLGIRKVIWLPGIAGKDITDGHTDFYARFIRPGVVVANLEQDTAHYDYALTRRHLDILRNATDVNNKRLQITTLSPPAQIRPEFSSKDFAAGYINFYLLNGAVLCPEFGDRSADEAARSALAGLYPERKIVMLNIDPIAWGGGGIHCATQHEVAS